MLRLKHGDRCCQPSVDMGPAGATRGRHTDTAGRPWAASKQPPASYVLQDYRCIKRKDRPGACRLELIENGSPEQD
jgi:hypothetical protein